MEQPYLRVVRGDATPEELAALVIALSATAAAPERTTREAGMWRSPAHRMRSRLPHGAGAWRTSSRPH